MKKKRFSGAAVVGDLEGVELHLPAIIETVSEARVQGARRNRPDLAVFDQRPRAEVACARQAKWIRRRRRVSGAILA